ncbi:MAG: AIM24 family protein [Actinobacteria bacterium]|nr:AIM24 family protein [Actinomycetota bacterium]
MDAAIRGTTMQALEVSLTPGESVIAEAGQLGWLDDGIELETTTALAGGDGVFDAAKRSFGGGTFFMTRYSSTTQPGKVTFPARLPGQIFQIPLGPGRSYLIQRHGFLAGMTGAQLSTAFDPRHVGSALFGGFGFLLQRLEGTGHAWVELSGELSEYELAEGQSLRVHPAHIGLVEGSISYELTTVPGMKNKIFGGDGLFLVRLTGPGKVCLQSLSLPMLAHALQPYIVVPGGGATPAGAVQGGLEAGLLGAAVKGLSGLV